MAKTLNRIGESRKMSNGQMATIVAYRGATDMDVKFDDGTIVTNKTYSCFKIGHINNPNYGVHQSFADSKIGETREMRNGMKATIIAYRTSTDMDLRFEDGTIREHARYHHFVSGKISPVHIDDRTANDKNARIGERRMMVCGSFCTIVDYKSSHDITVRFDDGVTFTKKYYRDFLNGLIQYHKPQEASDKDDEELRQQHIKERVGQSRQMRIGMSATITAYRSDKDMDVVFEDGETREHVQYVTFLNGLIRHPKQLTLEMQEIRVGERKKMNNGLFATIVSYKNWHNIDVQYDDGAVVEGQRYEKFKNGEIPHPNIKYKKNTSIQEFAIRYYLRELGFSKIQQGEWKEQGFGRLELDFYHEDTKVAIEYDGSVHNKKGSHERDLRKNKRCAEMGVRLYRLRDHYCKQLDDSSINYTIDRKKLILCGLFDCKEELENILRENDIPFDDNFIDFQRDKDKIMGEYNETYINYYSKERVGQRSYNKTIGQYMTIIKYNSAHDVDVQFDDGSIRHGIRYSEFKNGAVSHQSLTSEAKGQQRIGETKVMNNGLKATVIAYRSEKDIDVQFEDGYIRTNTHYGYFKRGTVAHLGLPNCLSKQNERLYEERIMNSGYKATVVRYANFRDIDVQFEDGKVRYNVDYGTFKSGKLRPPDEVNTRVYNANRRVGETNIMNNGKKATIIAYRCSSDIDIQFECGAIVTNREYADFKKGSIGYPSK